MDNRNCFGLPKRESILDHAWLLWKKEQEAKVHSALAKIGQGLEKQAGTLCQNEVEPVAGNCPITRDIRLAVMALHPQVAKYIFWTRGVDFRQFGSRTSAAIMNAVHDVSGVPPSPKLRANYERVLANFLLTGKRNTELLPAEISVANFMHSAQTLVEGAEGNDAKEEHSIFGSTDRFEEGEPIYLQVNRFSTSQKIRISLSDFLCADMDGGVITGDKMPIRWQSMERRGTGQRNGYLRAYEQRIQHPHYLAHTPTPFTLHADIAGKQRKLGNRDLRIRCTRFHPCDPNNPWRYVKAQQMVLQFRSSDLAFVQAYTVTSVLSNYLATTPGTDDNILRFAKVLGA